MLRRIATQARHYARNAAFPFVSVVILFISINDHVFEATNITGRSMQPTLSPNYHLTGAEDHVLFRKWRPTSNLQRGDVVLFHNPRKPEALSVKRVVALPGDTVLLDPRRRPKDAENGRPNSTARQWDLQFYRNRGRVSIPLGHVWVEGDNIGCSNDSNAYGPISKRLIIGKASGLIRPLSQFGARPWSNWNGRRTKVVPGHEPIKGDDTDEKPTWFAS